MVPWEVSAYLQDQLFLQHHQLPPDVSHHLQCQSCNKVRLKIVTVYLLLLDQFVDRVVLGSLDQLLDQRISIRFQRGGCTKCQRRGCTNRNAGASLDPIHCWSKHLSFCYFCTSNLFKMTCEGKQADVGGGGDRREERRSRGRGRGRGRGEGRIECTMLGSTFCEVIYMLGICYV